MENTKEENKCTFCDESITGTHYNGHDEGNFHLKCYDIITTIEEMDKVELLKLKDLIEKRLNE